MGFCALKMQLTSARPSTGMLLLLTFEKPFWNPPASSLILQISSQPTMPHGYEVMESLDQQNLITNL